MMGNEFLSGKGGAKFRGSDSFRTRKVVTDRSLLFFQSVVRKYSHGMWNNMYDILNPFYLLSKSREANSRKISTVNSNNSYRTVSNKTELSWSRINHYHRQYIFWNRNYKSQSIVTNRIGDQKYLHKSLLDVRSGIVQKNRYIYNKFNAVKNKFIEKSNSVFKSNRAKIFNGTNYRNYFKSNIQEKRIVKNRGLIDYLFLRENTNLFQTVRKRILLTVNRNRADIDSAYSASVEIKDTGKDRKTNLKKTEFSRSNQRKVNETRPLLHPIESKTSRRNVKKNEVNSESTERNDLKPSYNKMGNTFDKHTEKSETEKDRSIVRNIKKVLFTIGDQDMQPLVDTLFRLMQARFDRERYRRGIL